MQGYKNKLPLLGTITWSLTPRTLQNTLNLSAGYTASYFDNFATNATYISNIIRGKTHNKKISRQFMTFLLLLLFVRSAFHSCCGSVSFWSKSVIKVQIYELDQSIRKCFCGSRFFGLRQNGPTGDQFRWLCLSLELINTLLTNPNRKTEQTTPDCRCHRS